METNTQKISNKDLEVAYQNIQLASQPLIKEFMRVKRKFEEEQTRINEVFTKKLYEYYDQHIIDSNSNSIKIGDKITDGKYLYKVTDRGMQIVLGTLIFNNSIKCRKVQKDDILSKKEYTFGESEFNNLNII